MARDNGLNFFPFVIYNDRLLTTTVTIIKVKLLKQLFW